ncbi:MAG TPA: hypothetical protein VHC18_10590 [Amycolatopsis sp.]|nr:hypothetical protein [Amycolatopsis sp.]
MAAVVVVNAELFDDCAVVDGAQGQVDVGDALAVEVNLDLADSGAHWWWNHGQGQANRGRGAHRVLLGPVEERPLSAAAGCSGI